MKREYPRRAWTRGEDDYILIGPSIREAADSLGRSYDAVRRRRKWLRLSAAEQQEFRAAVRRTASKARERNKAATSRAEKTSRWTAAQDAYLREKWELPLVEQALHLGRTYDAVAARRVKLGRG